MNKALIIVLIMRVWLDWGECVWCEFDEKVIETCWVVWNVNVIWNVVWHILFDNLIHFHSIIKTRIFSGEVKLFDSLAKHYHQQLLKCIQSNLYGEAQTAGRRVQTS